MKRQGQGKGAVMTPVYVRNEGGRKNGPRRGNNAPLWATAVLAAVLVAAVASLCVRGLPTGTGGAKYAGALDAYAKARQTLSLACSDASSGEAVWEALGLDTSAMGSLLSHAESLLADDVAPGDRSTPSERRASLGPMAAQAEEAAGLASQVSDEAARLDSEASERAEEARQGTLARALSVLDRTRDAVLLEPREAVRSRIESLLAADEGSAPWAWEPTFSESDSDPVAMAEALSSDGVVRYGKGAHLCAHSNTAEGMVMAARPPLVRFEGRLYAYDCERSCAKGSSYSDVADWCQEGGSLVLQTCEDGRVTLMRYSPVF